MNRKRRIFVALIGICLCTYITYSYMQKAKEEIEFPEILYGIPTYQNSRLNYPMSGFNADPYTAVFLTDDSYEDVVAFYKAKLNMEPRPINYGRRNVVTMTIYQFKLEDGILTNQISKGVEIIPFNSFSRKVYKARTKIKIMVPQSEIRALTEGKEEEEKREQ